MLRSFPEAAGLRSGFTILDEDDQLRLLKREAESLRIDLGRSKPRFLLELITGWKDRALDPEAASRTPECAQVPQDRGAELYERYQSSLASLNACDFSDLLLHCVRVFQGFPELLS